LNSRDALVRGVFVIGFDDAIADPIAEIAGLGQRAVVEPFGKIESSAPRRIVFSSSAIPLLRSGFAERPAFHLVQK
jgi:hypothetical protein